MEGNDRQFVCTGNCIECTASQRAFCASQHSYRAMRMVQGMAAKIEDVEKKFISLSEKIEAIINNEATIFDPNNDTGLKSDPSEDTAQEGDGAEE